MYGNHSSFPSFNFKGTDIILIKEFRHSSKLYVFFSLYKCVGVNILLFVYSAVMSFSSDSPLSINIVAFNVWDLKYIAKFREERLEEIAKRIATANPIPEIVGLQECFTQKNYQKIRRHTKHILPYGKFYYSGIFGGGLVILSKWPIEESSMVRYPLNGRPTAFFRGDWFVGKGVACARIRLGPGVDDIAEVFCTHLHAPYESEPNDSYLCHRTAQAWEIAKLMRGAAERGHLVIGLGDFNMLPLSLAHQLITAHAPLQDAWRILHPDSSLGSANDAVERKRGRGIPTAQFNLTENGATCDSCLNTWRWSKDMQKKLFQGREIYSDPAKLDPGAKRLDYIFIGNGDKSTQPKRLPWQVQSIKLGMIERHPTIGCSLSDHFSIEATISRSVTANFSSPVNYPTNVLPATTYAAILSMISAYNLRENTQRRWRLGHFLLSILISVGCLTASWWSPRPFVSFLLVLLSTLGLGAGLLDGLIGGLFVGSEIRALKEFEWEIRNAQDIAGRSETKFNIDNKLAK